MLPILTEGVGNASAAHQFGRRQAATVSVAREEVAELVGGRPSDVVFTAGATEANNLALRGIAEASVEHRTRILVSAVEHASVSETARWLHEQGLAKLDVIPVTAGGFVDPDAVEVLLGPEVLLVSVMGANSETGVLNPVREIADRVHAAGALFHCDATQMVGRLPFDMASVGADFVSMSGHKICGPGGVGALIGTRASLRHLRPIIHGGGHERGLKSGSLNVAGIAGLGAAARIAAEDRESESVRVAELRDRFVADVNERLANVYDNGDAARRLAQAVRSPRSVAAWERVATLTDREKEILRLFAGGLTFQEIGEIRNINALTVRNALSMVQKKLGFETRHQMVIWAVQASLVSDPWS